MWGAKCPCATRSRNPIASTARDTLYAPEHTEALTSRSVASCASQQDMQKCVMPPPRPPAQTMHVLPCHPHSATPMRQKGEPVSPPGARCADALAQCDCSSSAAAPTAPRHFPCQLLLPRTNRHNPQEHPGTVGCKQTLPIPTYRPRNGLASSVEV